VAAILSRVRSEMISRSNWAKDKNKVVVHRHELAEAPRRSSGAVGVVLLLVALIIAGCVMFQEEEKMKQARFRLLDLDTALQQYPAERGVYPRRLEELIEQGGDDALHFIWRGYDGLYDPWGKHFEYYPDDRDLTGKPRVQTVRKFLGFGPPRMLRN